MTTVAIAGLVYIALAVTSFGLQLAKRLTAALWLELLAIVPGVIALVAAIAGGGPGWMVGLWVFSTAAAVWTAWWIAKRIRIEADMQADARRFSAFLDSYR